MDYLNGVLPTAQFGSESVVSLGKSGKELETSSDYKKWTTDSNPIPASSSVVVSQYASGNVANLVWNNGATGGSLLHSHIISSVDFSLPFLLTSPEFLRYPILERLGEVPLFIPAACKSLKIRYLSNVLYRDWETDRKSVV